LRPTAVDRPHQNGVIAIKLPLPPGTFPTLWCNDAKYKESYMATYPGYYFTGDGGYVAEDGYVYVMGRVDDVINVAGHKLSTGGMEEEVAGHQDVAECAVIGAEDQLKGQVPIGFVVLKAGVHRNPKEITDELVQMVRKEIGPLACFKTAMVVERLPKTRSGKILRGTMRKIADGQSYTVPSTIEDPTSLVQIEEAAGKVGYGKKS
jgi:propionyl-CoA synthetase